LAAHVPFLKQMTPHQREALQGYLYILPWFIGFTIFTAGPLIASLGLSFTDWGLIDTPTYIGLENYQKMRTDPVFEQALKVTLKYTVYRVPVVILLSLGVALLMTRPLPGMRMFRTIYYLPAVIGGVPMAMIWSWVLQPDYGIMNRVLDMVGIAGPDWLGDPNWALTAIIVISVWNIGFPMIVFIAGLQNISPVLYEAAILDGAGVWRKLRHITIPMLSPTIFFMLVMQIIGSFQVFDTVYVISNGRGDPLRSTLMYLLYFYRQTFVRLKAGYGSAMIWVLFIIIMFFTLLMFKSSSFWVYYETEVKNE
jgi:multiple sugar transport system permease protein